ncbi:MAG: caspase family protein, partial [Planctomycetaceae bacterium]|nr:caspase family protein [Planctomycetaceae bacterium]
FPPASEVTGGPVRAVAVASDGRHIVWDNRSHPAGGKFTRAFDPAFRSGGIEDAQDVDDPLDVPQVATSQVARISQGAVLLKPKGAGGAPLRLAQTEYFAEVIEKEDDDGRKFYRFRHRLPDVPGSFIDVAEKDVKFVQATRSHDLKPSGLRSANGLVVLTPDAPQMAGTTVLQRLDNGLFFEPQEFNGDWVRVTASGRSGWLEKNTVVGAEKWSIFDPNGQVIADLPVLKNNRPMVAARLQLDGRDLLAVGHQVGIRVWDLNALRRGIGRRALTRSFYGHPDQVRALSFSPDGRWLLSGSDDGTLSGWTLEGMTGGSELGATLNGQNRISAVPPRGSPAWEAGFERGQEVTSILIAGREVPRSSLADALRHSIPGDELSVNVAGGKGSLITPVQHDPLWIFYPFHNDDWVLWSPYSFFDSGFADEDSRQTERLKWQTDLAGIFVQGQQGVDVRRIFVQQASVQTRVFRQPALLNNLIAYRTVPPELFDIPSAPVMSLRFAAGQGQVPGGAVFSAFPLSPDEQVVSRTVFLNGLQVGQTDTQKVQAGANSQVQVPLDSSRFRSGENRVVGVAEVQLKSGGTDDQGRPLPAQKFTFRTVESFRFARTAAPAPRVHYLGIGVNTLDPKFQLPALRFAASGVQDVAEAVQQAVRQGTIRRSNPYSQGTHQLLADGGVAPTLAATEQAFSRLAADADPDDLAVIFLAGHGEGDSSGGFRFMLQDRPMQQQQLTSLLSSLPCRTLLLLDTCHAGSSAGSAEQIQLFSNIVNGPLVITACGADQESLEHDRIGGGFFTAALVEGLTGKSKVGLGELPVADTSGDGQISLEELCRFTQRRTSEMVEQAKEKLSLTGETQEPQFLQSSSFDDARQIFIR